MSDANFDRILELLKEIHEEFPELRFGQVLQNALDQEKGMHNVNLNDRSSKDVLSSLSSFKLHLQKRKERGVDR